MTEMAKESGPISRAIGKALYVALIVLIVLIAMQLLPYEQLHFLENFILKVLDKIPL